MPITSSAKKALRRDTRRTAVNNVYRAKLRSALKQVTKEPTAAHLSELQTAVDRAVKMKLVHKNKAARLKARFSKVVKAAGAEAPVKTEAKPAKKQAKPAKKTSTTKKSKSTKKSK